MSLLRYYARTKDGDIVWQSTTLETKPISQGDLEMIAVLDAGRGTDKQFFLPGTGCCSQHDDGFYAEHWATSYCVSERYELEKRN